jgi:Fe-coproporphyrin III synthase
MPGNEFSRAGFLPARVIHVHPSRFCNLACQHCYSSSGPDQRTQLAPEAIVFALSVLRNEGYEIISLSGGEPLLYSGFEEIVRNAIELGFQVNLITNGAPVGGKQLELIAAFVNLTAISLDGSPGTHIAMRGDPRAFIRVERALDRLAAIGAHYGLSYCVSRESIADMPWAVEFAAERDAALVQFHPFAATGRGSHVGSRLSLDDADKARAYVIATLLDSGQKPVIHLDLIPIAAALACRSDYRVLICDDTSSIPLSDLVNPLVIDELGRVLPLSYGINPQLMLGKLGNNLPTLISRYKAEGWRQLYKLLEEAFRRLGAHGEGLVDWFYHVVETSYSLPVSQTAEPIFCEAGRLR